ncbi:MAG TPA: hypothetical protein VHO29_18870 [Marmoricola sp.]|nr:hypothetical protein [Marmoricola sp.]
MSLIAVSSLDLVGRWSTRSQEQARRNAMAACTVLTARRLERLEVEAFIADRMARRTDAVAAESGAAMAGAG